MFKLFGSPDSVRKWAQILFCLVAALCLAPSVAWARRTHDSFFQGTDHELHVYRIYGKEPGKTLLIIGGIQGNEPGGFLSADLYADMGIAKGNLIVVPRANFYSILLNRRQINEDMNRKFAESSGMNYEARIVAILKELISQSDCLINLHEGSGFFSERWESNMRNPKRYGQSIIADCETYTNPKTGETLNLGAMARQVVNQVNRHIKEPDYRFRFNNHRTRDPKTLHPEQRKSATCYALYQCGIPAFGIEASKSLPMELKVRHHNLAINAFMDLLSITPETPVTDLAQPAMQYVVIAVNDKIPFAVPNGHALRINPGDVVRISHVEGNYKRGFSADILSYGTVNDMHKSIRITTPTQVVVRKDYQRCGTVDIILNHLKSGIHTVSAVPEILCFKTRINGNEHLFMNNDRVELINGDKFELVDVTTNIEDSSEVVVNFKGFVGNRKNNTGEDRGYVINTARDLWKRYSLRGMGKEYQVIVTHGDSELGRLIVHIADPVFDYVVLQVNDGVKRCLFPGDSITISSQDAINVLDVKTNVPTNAGVQAFLTWRGTKVRLFSDGAGSPWSVGPDPIGDNKNEGYKIVVQRDHIILGSIRVDFDEGAPYGG